MGCCYHNDFVLFVCLLFVVVVGIVIAVVICMANILCLKTKLVNFCFKMLWAFLYMFRY